LGAAAFSPSARGAGLADGDAIGDASPGEGSFAAASFPPLASDDEASFEAASEDAGFAL
jgi:hypothetical protein